MKFVVLRLREAEIPSSKGWLVISEDCLEESAPNLYPGSADLLEFLVFNGLKKHHPDLCLHFHVFFLSGHLCSNFSLL